MKKQNNTLSLAKIDQDTIMQPKNGMERILKATLLISRAYGKAFFQQIDNIYMTIDLDTFYGDIELAHKFSDVLKAGVRAEYELLFSLQEKSLNELLIPLAMQVIAYSMVHGVSNEKAITLVINKLDEFLGILAFDKNPTSVTLNFLRKKLNTLEQLSDDKLASQLRSNGITHGALIQEVIKLKHNLIISFHEYLQLAAKHCQQSGLDEESFDAIRIALFTKIQQQPQALLAAFIRELMTAYALHSDVRDVLFIAIVKEADAAPMSLNASMNYRKAIDLNQQVNILQATIEQQENAPQEEASHTDALQVTSPSEEKQIATSIQTVQEYNNQIKKTCELFTNTAPLIGIFKGCSTSPQYDENSPKQKAVQLSHDFITNFNLNQQDTLAQLNAFYTTSKIYINRHNSLILDSLFGIKNTNSWKMVAKEIREIAYTALMQDVAQINDLAQKIVRLKEARGMPLFSEPRGNFRKTSTTAYKIDEEIQKIEKQLILRPSTSSSLSP